MKQFLDYLAEAFPPPKKKSPMGLDPKGGSAKKPPFGGKPNQSPFAAKASGKLPADGESQDEETGMESDTQAPPFGQDQSNPELMGFQQAKMEAELEQEKEQEAERQRKEAELEAERLQIKKIRMQADAEVLDALDGKFNDSDDSITFYPDILSFGDFTKTKEDEKTGEKASEEDNKVDEEDDELTENDTKEDEQDESENESGDEDSDDSDDAKGFGKDKKKSQKPAESSDDDSDEDTGNPVKKR